MNDKYSIGLDFGTLSARAILVNVSSGEEIAVSVFGYQDAVIDKFLPETSSDVMKALKNIKTEASLYNGDRPPAGSGAKT